MAETTYDELVEREAKATGLSYEEAAALLNSQYDANIVTPNPVDTNAILNNYNTQAGAINNRYDANIVTPNSTYAQDINAADNKYNETLTQLSNQHQNALNDLNSTYGNMITDADKYYQAQIDAANQWAQTQQNLQNQQTEFAIQEINQNKEQARKDYLKEQSGSYVDWQKQANKYGAEAERMAASGLTGTGYSESSQVAMYNQYQSRVAVARESYNLAVQNYNNAITEARLQNNSALAQIAYQALQTQLELSLQGFQYKNTLLLDQMDKKTALEDTYWQREQAALTQLNTEKDYAFKVEQAAIENALNQNIFNETQRQNALKELQYATGLEYDALQDAFENALKSNTLNETQRQNALQNLQWITNHNYGVARDEIEDAFAERELAVKEGDLKLAQDKFAWQKEVEALASQNGSSGSGGNGDDLGIKDDTDTYNESILSQLGIADKTPEQQAALIDNWVASGYLTEVKHADGTVSFEISDKYTTPKNRPDVDVREHTLEALSKNFMGGAFSADQVASMLSSGWLTKEKTSDGYKLAMSENAKQVYDELGGFYTREQLQEMMRSGYVETYIDSSGDNVKNNNTIHYRFTEKGKQLFGGGKSHTGTSQVSSSAGKKPITTTALK